MDTSSFDRMRDWLEGRLSPEEAEAFQRERLRDPEWARLVDEYAKVHELTRPFAEVEAESATAFEDIERRLPREAPRASRPRRAAAVAAGLLFVAVAGGLWWRAGGGGTGEPDEVELVAIPQHPATGASPAPSLPPGLASYRPVEEGEVRWFSDLADARAFALATDRPVVVFGTLPGCVWCEAMKNRALRDSGVLELVDEYIPVEVDLASADEDLRESLMARGYPFLEVQDGSGAPLYNFSGRHDERSFADHLERGLAEGGSEERPDWRDVHARAELLDSALAAEHAGRLGAAYADFGRLLKTHPSEPFDAWARGGRARVAEAARALVERAREADAAEQRRLVEDGMERFAGSPFEDDFRRIRARLERGTFPELTWPR